MIVKRILLAQCQMCIQLDGSMSILKNEFVVGGGTFFEFFNFEIFGSINLCKVLEQIKA